MVLTDLRPLSRGGSRVATGSMEQLLSKIFPLMAILDTLSSATIFFKDDQARYVFANQTLVQRCGFNSLAQVLQKSSEEIFPDTFGSIYKEQDWLVLRQGVTLENQLELHLNTERRPAWCLTHKRPIHSSTGTVIGLAGISKDLLESSDMHPVYARLAEVDQHIRREFYRTITMRELTCISGSSVTQLERFCKKVFGLTPRQMILRVRMDHACRLLRASRLSITEVALECGYADHSAFARRFKQAMGVTPSELRSLAKEGA